MQSFTRSKTKRSKLGKFDEDLKPNEIHVKTEKEAGEIVAEAEKEEFRRRFRHDQRAKTQSDAAVHHFKAAAGSIAKIRLSGQKDDDGRAKALRRHRAWERKARSV